MMETKAKKGDLVCVISTGGDQARPKLYVNDVVKVLSARYGAVTIEDYKIEGTSVPYFLTDNEYELVGNPEDYDKLIERGVDGELREIYVPKDRPLKAKKGDLVRVISTEVLDVNAGEVFEVGEIKPSVSGYMNYEMLGSSPENDDNVFLFGDEFELLNEEESPQQVDAVNHPSHYTQGRFEVIDIIEDAVQGADPFEAVCLANVIKYTTRYRHKNGVEDLKKAQWYLAKLITILEGGNE